MSDPNVYAAPESEILPVAEGYRDSVALSQSLKLWLKIYLAISVLGLALIALFQLEIIPDSEITYLIDSIQTSFITIAYIVCIVLFSKWIHRSNKNASYFNLYPMRYSAGWSVGYYFIPILNLFRPYQAMKDIWLGSITPGHNAKHTQVKVWWTLWIFETLTESVSSNFEEHSIVSICISALTCVLLIFLCISAIKMVTTITSNQAALASDPPESIDTVAEPV